MAPSDPLLQVLDEGRRSEAVDARQQQRSLRAQRQEDATVMGTLVDLAERGASVILRTTAGRRHVGVLVAVGPDWCALRSEQGSVVLRLASVSTVRTSGGSALPAAADGDRIAAADLLFVDLLAHWALDNTEVALVTADGEVLTGELRGVGLDVLTLRSDGPVGPTYVAVSSLSEVSGRRSG